MAYLDLEYLPGTAIPKAKSEHVEFDPPRYREVPFIAFLIRGSLLPLFSLMFLQASLPYSLMYFMVLVVS